MSSLWKAAPGIITPTSTPPPRTPRIATNSPGCSAISWDRNVGARLDPEDTREVIRAYHDACSGAIARYDGFVAKFNGESWQSVRRFVERRFADCCRLAYGPHVNPRNRISGDRECKFHQGDRCDLLARLQLGHPLRGDHRRSVAQRSSRTWLECTCGRTSVLALEGASGRQPFAGGRTVRRDRHNRKNWRRQTEDV